MSAIFDQDTSYLRPVAGFDPSREMDGYHYDHELACRAVNFFPDMLCHTNNSRYTRANTPFELQDWQKTIVGLLFGVVDGEGLRRFRTVYVEVPRKNGKTTLAAGIAAYTLFCDNEAGAQVYAAASTRDQASLLFDVAAGMVKKSEVLGAESEIKQSIKRIVFRDSYLRAVSSDAHSLHGLNSHCVVADELHAWQKGGFELYSVLATGCASRANPIMLSITTAGYDKQSKCYEMHEYAKAVRDGTADDPSFLPIVYGAEPADDWQSPEVWAKANPNLGISIPPEYLQQQCRVAQKNLGFQNDFRRLHLNQWTSQKTRWLSMDAWAACHDPDSME